MELKHIKTFESHDISTFTKDLFDISSTIVLSIEPKDDNMDVRAQVFLNFLRGLLGVECQWKEELTSSTIFCRIKIYDSITPSEIYNKLEPANNINITKGEGTFTFWDDIDPEDGGDPNEYSLIPSSDGNNYYAYHIKKDVYQS